MSPQYDQFEATELWCPDCGKAQPVRSRLLLVLPSGNKFDYRCSVCNRSLGDKLDDDSSEFDRIAGRASSRERS